LHEGADLMPGECREMRDLLHLAALGQELIEVAAPPGRILAVTPVARFAVIKHRLDAATHSRCCLGFRGPQRFEDLHYRAGIDVADRQMTEYRQRIVTQ